jgi:hypothetical protein
MRAQKKEETNKQHGTPSRVPDDGQLMQLEQTVLNDLDGSCSNSGQPWTRRSEKVSCFALDGWTQRGKKTLKNVRVRSGASGELSPGARRPLVVCV